MSNTTRIFNTHHESKLNCSRLTVAGQRLLFSYTSIAAGSINGQNYLVSDCRQSNTTSKHIAWFFGLDGWDRKDRKKELASYVEIEASELENLFIKALRKG